MKTKKIPEHFMPKTTEPYPPHNLMTVEEYVYSKLKDMDVKTKRTYVPIFWTPYYVMHNYAKDEQAVKQVNSFCSHIKGQWFTISQYDDGAMVGMEQPTNCLTFSAGGKGNIALPLTSYRWPEIEIKPPRQYHQKLCSFIGNARTHPIREQMFKELEGKPGFYLEQVPHHLPHYAKVMNESTFALCPRGYGKTSFRLFEATSMGTIPIYISDEHWLPFSDILDWNVFCIVIKPEQIKDIPGILYNMQPEKEAYMSQQCKKVWDEYFSYDAVVKQIVRILEAE
jgi:hypothetical protein